MKYPTSLQDKKYPEFIRKSMIVKAYPKPKKVFPYIGLHNQELALDKIIVEPSYLSIQSFLQEVYDNLENVYDKLCSFNMLYPNHNGVEHNHMLETDIAKIIDNVSYMVDDAGYKAREDWFVKNKDSYKIVYYNSYGPRAFNLLKMPKDKSLLTLLDKINALLKPLKLSVKIPKLRIQNTTADHLLASNKKNLKVVFSSDGNQGMWDIATMSQGRGITSCMSWNSDNSTSLLGSMVDPFAGIIYITDGSKTKNGCKMLYRSVVRLAVSDSGKNHFVIENAYGNSIGNSKDEETKVGQIFASFIKQVTKNKVKVIYCDSNMPDSVCEAINELDIPLSEPVKQIMDMSGDMFNYEYAESQFLSYRDSEIKYCEISGFDKIEKIRL